MGVHKRQRELNEFKRDYVRKSSCVLLVCIALLVGVFIGNAVTVFYMGQKEARRAVTGASRDMPVSQAEQHVANPAALAQLEQDAAAEPTNANSWIKLGNFCFDHNLPAKAVIAYERAVELAPMQVDVWSDLGVMYRRTGQFKKALEAFGHAASLDQKHITSRFNMGIVYLHDLNDRKNALSAWEEILDIDPDAVTPSGQKVSELVEGVRQ